jgi:hypothetical protein
MADTNPSQQTESEAQGPTSTEHHAYDAPNISAKEFLLRVMHDPDAPIRDRIKAASTLLRLFPYGWDPPRLKYVIPEFPSDHHCTERRASSSDHPGEGETTEINSHFSAIAHKAPSRMTDDPRPLNIETIISDIKSGNYPQPTLCSICGHYMPYPCSKTPMH